MNIEERSLRLSVELAYWSGCILLGVVSEQLKEMLKSLKKDKLQNVLQELLINLGMIILKLDWVVYMLLNE